MSVLNYLKLDGTQAAVLKINAATSTGVKLNDNTGALVVTNGSSVSSSVTASEFLATGNTGLVINSGATETGADWKFTLSRPTTGMTADTPWVVPATNGSSGQVLSTDGAGNLSWVNSSSGATDTTIATALVFGSTSTVTIGTLPANATITSVEFIVDTAWDTAANFSVGVSGTPSKYMGSGDSNLEVAAGWSVSPNLPPDGSSEALIITYAAAASTVGAGRLLITYFV